MTKCWGVIYHLILLSSLQAAVVDSHDEKRTFFSWCFFKNAVVNGRKERKEKIMCPFFLLSFSCPFYVFHFLFILEYRPVNPLWKFLKWKFRWIKEDYFIGIKHMCHRYIHVSKSAYGLSICLFDRLHSSYLLYCYITNQKKWFDFIRSVKIDL